MVAETNLSVPIGFEGYLNSMTPDYHHMYSNYTNYMKCLSLRSIYTDVQTNVCNPKEFSGHKFLSAKGLRCLTGLCNLQAVSTSEHQSHWCICRCQQHLYTSLLVNYGQLPSWPQQQAGK